MKALLLIAALLVSACGILEVGADAEEIASAERSGPGQTYYVSPTGKDSNSGTSRAAPWQSLGKVAGSLFNPGDSILLEGGASFSGCLQVTREMAMGSDALPITIGAYGTGKFHIKASCEGESHAAIDIVGASGIVIQDCILPGDGGKTPFGVWIRNPFDGEAKNITVRRCDISGFYTKKSKENGSEIFETGHHGVGLNGIKVIEKDHHGADGPTSPDNNGL